MTALTNRHWVPETSETLVQKIASETATATSGDIAARLETLAMDNRTIHESDCFNLNPATNVINPRAAALLSSGIGERPSLGYPGDKYEMGLEAIEEIEVICAELAAEVFRAKFAEIRVPSGAIANLYAFMATCKPGDTIIAPPASVGGHVTHHTAGCAGLYGLNVLHAPVDADGYTVDLEGLRKLAQDARPKLITIGCSLNLFPHPVAEIRTIADEVGAKLLFDAAHQCGIIAGQAWPDPLEQGAHLMTMSTYKSLGGPAGGLIVSNDPDLAEKLDAIAFPGMTANFDAAKSAALAMSLLDWRDHGKAYAAQMIAVAQALAAALHQRDVPVFQAAKGGTLSHQFAIKAAAFGGGQTASKKLRKAGFLTCGIGLPITELGNDLNGLRIGTPEIVRWGVTPKDVPELADLLNRALHANAPETLASETKALRARFNKLHYINGS
ncbi:serine hydroxymethyltransferase [Neptunicoccus cionae]|uniref:Serine hydroxymethyltransferase n=1 Tax=Neptunicoccus cionae TaxID=2035344 RepID=A0A916VLT3_9RHOB|nr:aminotransferase class I/II-fold pyridoxal phosphate-dependent enzyme [Amylibacter cionae]GGA05064.1 serine hydroxymethyltransferase [Amylibacter cionae]